MKISSISFNIGGAYLDIGDIYRGIRQNVNIGGKMHENWRYMH
jgi:hypothetical protein